MEIDCILNINNSNLNKYNEGSEYSKTIFSILYTYIIPDIL